MGTAIIDDVAAIGAALKKLQDKTPDPCAPIEDKYPSPKPDAGASIWGGYHPPLDYADYGPG